MNAPLELGFSHIVILGAGSVLAQHIADVLCRTHTVVGISRHRCESGTFHVVREADARDYVQLSRALAEAVPADARTAVICGIGRFPERQQLSDVTEACFYEVFTTNVLVFINALRFSRRHFTAECPFAFVTFGTVSQPYHYPMMGIYNAAKAALVSAVHSAAHELAGSGVRFFHLNLSTIRDPKESRFTQAEANELLDCQQVALQIAHLLASPTQTAPLVEMDMYVPNLRYYHEGYFTRIPQLRSGDVDPTAG